MTCIAWDGKTLAADKKVSAGYATPWVTTKIFKVTVRLGPGKPAVPGVAGTMGTCDISAELLAWYLKGAKATDFPKSAREHEGSLVVIHKGGILQYTGGPFPMKLEDTQCAWGSGGDLARLAMHLGKTAKEAVELACLFEPAGCGLGIDTLTLGRTK